jgi:hypothetical protein
VGLQDIDLPVVDQRSESVDDFEAVSRSLVQFMDRDVVNFQPFRGRSGPIETDNLGMESLPIEFGCNPRD